MSAHNEMSSGTFHCAAQRSTLQGLLKNSPVSKKERVMFKSDMDGGFNQYSQSSGRTPVWGDAFCLGSKLSLSLTKSGWVLSSYDSSLILPPVQWAPDRFAANNLDK
jgi:hypothetical protein